MVAELAVTVDPASDTKVDAQVLMESVNGEIGGAAVEMIGSCVRELGTPALMVVLRIDLRRMTLCVLFSVESVA